MEKKKETLRIIAILLFLAYLLLLAYLLFFSSAYGRTEAMGYRYNLKPFLEIARGIRYIDHVGYSYVLMNIGGNIAAFMPFGWLVPLISERRQNTGRILLQTFLLSLTAETIQLVTRTGAFDVDDLILNTIGGILGYWCYYLLFGRRKKK